MMKNSGLHALNSRRGALVLGGTHGSLEIARSLGRRSIPVWLVVADNPLPTWSRYVERSFTWSGPRGNDAVAFLIELARRHYLGGWVLFAGSDDDLRFIAQNHSVLGAIFTLTTPSLQNVQSACDKRCMNARAAALGLSHPQTRYPRTRDDLLNLELSFPVILKPTIREGRNAFIDAKAWRVDDQRTLLVRYEEAKALIGADSVMVQELIPGGGEAQFSYAAAWHHGAPVGSLVARRRRQFPVDFGFTSTFVETIESPEIDEAASRFLRSLDYSGLVEIEFKFDARDGSCKILDVNGRAWTWIALGAAAGVDFPTIQWQLAIGEKVTPISARPGVNWLYLSRDLLAAMHEIIAGSTAPLDYLRSVIRPSASATFAWDDLGPAMLDLPLALARGVRRWRCRNGKAAAATLRLAKFYR